VIAAILAWPDRADVHRSSRTTFEDGPMHSVVWPAALTVGAGVSVLVQQALNAN
jgi:hypothetical protein